MGELYATVWEAFAAGEASRRAALTPEERDEEDRMADIRKAELDAIEARMAAKARADNAEARKLLEQTISALETAGAFGAFPPSGDDSAVTQLRDTATMGGYIVTGQVETLRRKDRRGFFDSTEWVKFQSLLYWIGYSNQLPRSVGQ